MGKKYRKVKVGDTVYRVRNIDLDEEEVYLSDGTRLTEAKAVELAEETAKIAREIRAGGRPSLTAPGVHSPQITFRLSPEFMGKVDKVAARQGKTRSQLSREALEKLIEAEGV